MASFISSLSPNSDAIAIFVNDKYDYKDKKSVLSKQQIEKINSFIKISKSKKIKDEIISFDISDNQKCFIVKIKSKYETFFPQECGGRFFSHLKKIKDLNKIDLCIDTLNFEKQKLVSFFSEFCLGFNLKSYTFNKYKTTDKEKINKKIIFNIITDHKEKLKKEYNYFDSFLISSVYYISNKILTGKETINYLIKGMSGMMQLSILILLAFAVGNLCNELGTGVYVSNSIKDIISPELIPFLLFITSCFISFSTGTSWGTFAIMVAIAVPISNELGINPSMAIAASLGGGVFGDHCSPISDSSVVSSMASASDHIDHVKTQIPYAAICGITSAIMYLILGYYSF